MTRAIAKYEVHLGRIGTILCVIMFTGLIEVAINNYHHNSRIWIQPLLTIINNSIWCLYGTAKNDKYLVLANSAGIFFAILTILAIFMN